MYITTEVCNCAYIYKNKYKYLLLLLLQSTHLSAHALRCAHLFGVHRVSSDLWSFRLDALIFTTPT